MSMLKRVASTTLLTGLLIGGGAAIASAQSSGNGPTTSPTTAAPAAPAAPAAGATADPAGTDPADGRCLPPGHDDSWPRYVQGKPDNFEAGGPGGVYVWHDAEGWHLRVTHRTDEKAVFTGTIATRGRLVDVHGVALEGNDWLKVGPHQHELRFSFNNYGHIDGIDFRTACAPALAFSFQRGGIEVPAGHVFLGDEARHPDSDPFRIARLP
jgi:hypothetical protein